MKTAGSITIAMDGKIDEETKSRRLSELIEFQNAIVKEQKQKRVGSIAKVMMKLTNPRPTISFVRLQEIWDKQEKVSLSSDFPPVRKNTTNTAETIWEITVAMAAPCTPIWKKKIKIGSRMILVTAPMKMVIM